MVEVGMGAGCHSHMYMYLIHPPGLLWWRWGWGRDVTVICTCISSIPQDYYGGGGDGGGRGPTILARGDKSGPARMPGSIAIMQRASSGGNMATSPLKSNASSGTCTCSTCCTCTCTALGVLCYFALFVCLTLLASFFLPSHLSFKNMHIYMYMYMHIYRG